jgi:hypothetical protein
MGYPTDFYIDVSQLIADEEQGYTVTSLIRGSSLLDITNTHALLLVEDSQVGEP